MNEWLGKVKNLLIGGRNKIQLVLPASLNVREIIVGSGELGGNQPLQMDIQRASACESVDSFFVSLLIQ